MNKEELVSKKTGFQFVKFAIVGIINTGVDWLIFFLLAQTPFFGLREVLAKSISFLISATNSFLMNSYWTFRKEYFAGMKKAEAEDKTTKKGTKYYIKFMLVSLVGWGLNTLIFYIMRNYIVEDMALTQSRFVSLFFASGFVVVWNFLANKLWTYK